MGWARRYGAIASLTLRIIYDLVCLAAYRRDLGPTVHSAIAEIEEAVIGSSSSSSGSNCSNIVKAGVLLRDPTVLVPLLRRWLLVDGKSLADLPVRLFHLPKAASEVTDPRTPSGIGWGSLFDRALQSLPCPPIDGTCESDDEEDASGDGAFRPVMVEEHALPSHASPPSRSSSFTKRCATVEPPFMVTDASRSLRRFVRWSAPWLLPIVMNLPRPERFDCLEDMLLGRTSWAGAANTKARR